MNNFKISAPKIILILSILSFATLFSCNQKSTKKIIPLNEDWEFYYSPTNQWYAASVPGNIHTDLFTNNLIDNPFYAHEDSLSWISETEWHYRKQFSIAKLFYNRNLEIVFDGIDTHCDVILNGDTIGRTSNMYRQWVFPITDSIKKEDNEIELVFYPSSQVNATKADIQGYAIPDDRVFTRKAPYQYGWDWAPKLETCGIYKDVYINSWEKLRVLNINIESKFIADTMAIMTANIELESENFYNGNVKIYSPTNEFDTLYQKLEIYEGKSIYPVDFNIRNPQLWWCNGMGESKIYDIIIEVSTKFRVESQSIKTGIRNIELVTENDASGQQFYFILNGIPVFARGANWIPAEYFSGSNSSDKYLELLELAKEANFNMLRVWGGGIYENDEFYEICDSLGIMVWQDFMFSCAMYPLDEEITNNITEEVKYQVKRLYNHPSIVMWCGNNEISNAWFDWGWQKQFNLSEKDSLEIWNDYDNLFHRIIPKAIAEIDNKRTYIPSSPFFGWGHKESVTHGDNHYWGVWWGMLPFDKYRENTGRFMSEYGFQGMPAISSLKKFIPEDSLYLYSQNLKHHQKHPFGFEAIDTYMKRTYPAPEKFDDYVYISQLLQAEGMQAAFDAHIGARPYCMGSLFWQFNDCWPVTSWSAVDYYLQPKAVYYFAKTSFDNIHSSVHLEDKKLKCLVTNHNNKTINSKIVIELRNFSGEIIHSDSINIILDLLRTSKPEFYHTPDSIFLNHKDDAFLTLNITDLDSDIKIFSKSFVLGDNKNLTLPQSDFTFNIQMKKNHWKITLKPKVFIKNIYLYLANGEGRFSDNFFNLVPGKNKTIYYYPKGNDDSKNLKFKSVNQIINDTVNNNKYYNDSILSNN
ncbi:MAG: glycoside hydrolase family 2 TIM barrel-domain containing protein [Bacteroidales bacterium]|nr:glycoside hydrolase family 2 TIM barrel-domain containing protein [Bacteroidales bacterium]